MKAGAISSFIAALLVFHLPAGAMALGRLDGNRSLNDKKHGYAISSDVARAGKNLSALKSGREIVVKTQDGATAQTTESGLRFRSRKRGAMGKTSGSASVYSCRQTSRPVPVSGLR